MILRGVDGCPAGWIAASLDLGTGKVTAALWTAQRIHSGTAVKLPSSAPELDACGLPMQMLA